MSRDESSGTAGALEERRRIVLRDLEELAEQVADGEIDEATASRLEAGYRAELAEVERALKARPSRLPKAESEVAKPAKTAAPAAWTRHIVWAMGAAVLVLTGVIVFLATRSGGDGAAAATTTQAGALPDDIAELEAVVAAHPESNAMRLTLAGLYFDRGDYLEAMEHYLAVLDNSPTAEEEAMALARVGWMAYITEQPQTAVAYLEQSIAKDPSYGEAKLFLGVVLLYGMEDPAAALPLLEEVLAMSDLPGELRPEVEQMVAEARGGGGSG